MTVDRDIVDELSKEAVAFRSSQLLALNRSEVTALEGSFGESVFALGQKDGGWTSQGRPILAPAADDVLTAILDLKSKSFLDEGETKALAAPVATVSVRTAIGTPWTVSLHPRTGEMVARVSPRPGGFLLDRDAPSKLEAAFRKAVTAPTPAAKRAGNGKR